MDAKNSFLPEAFQRTSFKGQKTDSWRNVVTLMQPKTPDEIFIIFFKQEKKFFFFLFFRAFESFLSGLFRRLTNREQLEQPLQEKWEKYEKKIRHFFLYLTSKKLFFFYPALKGSKERGCRKCVRRSHRPRLSTRHPAVRVQFSDPIVRKSRKPRRT